MKLWDDFEVGWTKLALGRVMLFGLLAVDAVTQIAHAPRYGAGDFNLAQLPWLDAVGPTRVLYGASQLVLAHLFVLVACGVATRIALPIAAAIYGWLYFGSQLDSYQHHYLVWLIVLLSCFVPWQRAEGATHVRSWALRLILVQLGIVYLWAAISKLDPAWLDGRTLALQIQDPLRSVIDATLGMQVASWLVVATELVLAATVWSSRTWRVAAPLGIAFHAGVLISGLEVGAFAWLMLALYIFVVPDRVWTWFAARRPLVHLHEVARVIASSGVLAWLAIPVAAVLALLCRFEHAVAVALVLTAAVLAAAVTRRASFSALAAAHVTALVVWTVVDRTTSTAIDYYRFWGGSARRLGDASTAEHAYRNMIEVAPREPSGHYQLGRLLLARNAAEPGLAELRAAESLEPMRTRAYLAEARWLAAHDRRAEAIAKAREATIVAPNDAEARDLLNSLIAKP